MIRALLALVAAVALAASSSTDALGQDASPAPGPTECTVEPYDLTTVLTPSEGTAAAEAPTAATPTERPTGEPADDETVAAVTETIETFVGCFNAGYQLRILYLFTPEYLQVFVSEAVGSLTVDEIAQLNEAAASEETAEPLPEAERTVINSIEDVEVLDDGRVIATVIGDDLSEPGGPNPIYFVFREVDGRYLIDDVIDPQPDATPEA